MSVWPINITSDITGRLFQIANSCVAGLLAVKIGKTEYAKHTELQLILIT